MSFAVVHDLLSGIENAPSGDAWFYLPGTLTQIVIYGDDSGTATTNPVTLDSSGRATVYLSQQARMVVQTAAGVTVVDTVINKELDSLVSVDSDAFTGDTLGDVLDAAQTAFGGQDFKYKPAIGAIAGMTPKAWMSGVHYNVLSFAASTAPTINDGVTPADTAIASAVAAAVAAGGGVVYFPPAIKDQFYLITQPIAITSGVGVILRGSAYGTSTIKNNAAGNAITLSTCDQCSIENLSIGHTSSSAGAGISLANSPNTVVRQVAISAHQIGIDISGAGVTSTLLETCNISTTTNAASRAVRYNTTGTSTHHRIVGSSLNGSASGVGVEYNGTVSRCVITECFFTTAVPTAVLFNAALTGTRFDVHSCPAIGAMATTTPFDLSGLAADPLFRQTGNGVDGYTVSVAVAGSHTPTRSRGPEIRIVASSGGPGTVTVNAPTPAPTSTMRDVPLTIKFVNAAGGAVTWAFAAATFVFVGAAVPANTDLHTITLMFLWDPDASRWREVARGDTLT